MHFLRVSSMRVGKLFLALSFPLQCIDHTIPAFHEELLSAWQKFRPCRFSTQTPTTILKEPLFLNKQITISDESLLYRNWIAAGITNISDACYEVVPNLLPAVRSTRSLVVWMKTVPQQASPIASHVQRMDQTNMF